MIAPHWIDTPLLQSSSAQLKAKGVHLSYASIDHVVDAMVKSATDESAGGKSWGVWPDGWDDFEDNEAGLWGAKRMKEHLRIERGKGVPML
jgi:hypothetical protein